MYACQSYGWWFYITYLPTFLDTHYDVPKTALGGLLKGGPLLMGAVSCLLGGVLSDWLIRRTGNRRLARRLLGASGHALTMICFLVCRFAPLSLWGFVATISLAGFCTDFATGPAWATCQDIGKRYAAVVAGCMNMMGNLGSTVTSWITGWVDPRSLASYAGSRGFAKGHVLTASEKALGEAGGYQLTFLLFAAAFLIGAPAGCGSTPPARCCRMKRAFELHGNGERERRSLARLAAGPNPAPVPLDDPLADGQADAGPGIVAVAVQPLKDHEQLVLVLLLKADAVVGDAEEPLPLLLPGGNADLRRTVRCAELDGVADQVLKQLGQLGLVAADRGQGIVRDRRAALADGGAEVPRAISRASWR